MSEINVLHTMYDTTIRIVQEDRIAGGKRTSTQIVLTHDQRAELAKALQTVSPITLEA